jgi:hypothetical protein
MNDRLFALASLALAGGYYLLARNVPASELADSTGPAGLPVIYAATLAGLSLMLLARPLQGGSKGTAEARLHGRSAAKERRQGVPVDGGPARHVTSAQDLSYKGVGRAALTLAVGAVYVAVVPIIGYAAGVAALIAATAWAYGASLNVRTTIVAMSGAAVLWLLFVWLLGIQQPPGLWPDLVGLALAPPGGTTTSP